MALLTGGVLGGVYQWYLRGNDVSPDSGYGYGFAVAGTLLLLLVGVGYVIRKRLRRNWVRMLHTMLAWHIAGGILGLALILMHAAGNFHPRSGTYALYGLIALVVSGLIGRLIDRLAPRFMAGAAVRALTSDGEERLEVLVGSLSARQGTHRWRRKRAEQPAVSGTPWDLAYYDLEPELDAIPTLLRQNTSGHAGADAYDDPRRLRHGAATSLDLAGETAALQRATGSEQFYRQLVRVWRRLHMLLSVVTLGLILWHLEYAATLLISAH